MGPTSSGQTQKRLAADIHIYKIWIHTLSSVLSLLAKRQVLSQDLDLCCQFPRRCPNRAETSPNDMHYPSCSICHRRRDNERRLSFGSLLFRQRDRKPMFVLFVKVCLVTMSCSPSGWACQKKEGSRKGRKGLSVALWQFA